MFLFWNLHIPINLQIVLPLVLDLDRTQFLVDSITIILKGKANWEARMRVLFFEGCWLVITMWLISRPLQDSAQKSGEKSWVEWKTLGSLMMWLVFVVHIKVHKIFSFVMLEKTKSWTSLAIPRLVSNKTMDPLFLYILLELERTSDQTMTMLMIEIFCIHITTF